jgi:hypothetical protein
VKAGGVLLAMVVGTAVAGCGSSHSTSRPTPRRAPPAILTAPVRSTTFTQVRGSLLALYGSHPAIRAFAVKDVEYTPVTRDKVLTVCHVGGPEKSARALESARVLACAPLIFFYYSYGRSASAPDAIAVAQRLYWYAVTANRHPYAAQPGLTNLLRSWGIA